MGRFWVVYGGLISISIVGVVAQLWLRDNYWFLHDLGSCSPFVIYVSHLLGINVIPIIIDTSILIALILRSRDSLVSLGKALPCVASSSVAIALVVVTAFMIMIHGIGNALSWLHDLTKYSPFIAQVVAALAVFRCAWSMDYGLRGFTALTYIGVLITGYLTDSINAITLSIMGIRAVIGGLGPLDNLVILTLLITLIYSLIARLRISQIKTN